MKIKSEKNDILYIYAQNINCGYTLEPPRQGCFGRKIRKIGIPLQTPVKLLHCI